MPSVLEHSTDKIDTPVAIPPAQVQRFTLDGGDALESHLDSLSHDVLSGIQRIVPYDKLQGVLLGGGYGRSEGGVLTDERGDHPYNDLEFYVFISGNTLLNERKYGASLHRLAEELSHVAGIEVELKILSLEKLRRSPPSMFYYDLVMGHRWLLGDDKLLTDCDHHRDAGSLPLSEATRLMMNRCAGLLFAKDRLRRVPFTAEDADFVGRNVAKAQLALGDALLAHLGRYHWSCRERHKRLNQLAHPEELHCFASLLKHHDAGVQFKLRPYYSTQNQSLLDSSHQQVSALAAELWLWLETRRLNQTFTTVVDYGLSPDNKWPNQTPLHNALINLKVFGLLDTIRNASFIHPRSRVLSALALLLWSNPEANPQMKERIKRLLFSSHADVEAFHQVWRHVS
jgi:hypothetical protein